MSTVNAVLTDGYAVDLASSTGHRWQADEPVAVGGTDTGPNPYELLLSALAACTTITLSMYAQRKGWDVQRIEVAYDHGRIHARDCEDCEDHQKGYIDHITSQVSIHGDLDGAQQRRLAEVAASCPVHKTLAKGVHLTDEVSFA